MLGVLHKLPLIPEQDMEDMEALMRKSSINGGLSIASLPRLLKPEGQWIGISVVDGFNIYIYIYIPLYNIYITPMNSREIGGIWDGWDD